MAMTLNYLPASIIGGETIMVGAANPFGGGRDIILAGYSPATPATLSYHFQSATPLTIEAAPNSGNTGWTLTVAAAETLTLGPGPVAYAGVLTIDGATKVVDTGIINVRPSPLRVSSWLAVVTAIDAALLTAASSPSGSISIDGMSISYRSPDQLIRLRDYAAGMAARESATGTMGGGRIIRTRFRTL